jgi:hypothetical protein
MKPDFDHDEKFMARFSNRLALEPAPQWTLRKKAFPWLEIGWAFAAALLLAVYWTELRFGFFSLHAVVDHVLSHIPVRKLFVFIAAGISVAAWLGPKLAREL